jgi:hypothetical protein
MAGGGGARPFYRRPIRLATVALDPVEATLLRAIGWLKVLQGGED